MPISAVVPTERFVAGTDGPVQLLEVRVDAPSGDVEVLQDGRVIGRAPAAAVTEVPLEHLAGSPGDRAAVTVRAAGEEREAETLIAQPGWTVWMISHFHYDPVWWNTQAAYTSTWDDLGEEAQRVRAAFQQTGFTLVREHLATARRDPDYRFVLAEVDYLKPYWDAHPEERQHLRRLIAEGRAEIVGGTYNEPNTNLTTAETTARNFVYGAGFQRSVLGADPQSAWQLDVFGHDPQFPGLAAAAGLSSSSWARGPFHQWGPMMWTHEPRDGWADPSVMQFPAEFEWLSPSGAGVLTHYMPAHYSAGWRIDSKTTLAEAENEVYQLFLLLRKVAATRNLLLPVGTDYTPPSKWVTEIARDWNRRYVSPRFVCGLPKEFFGAVRAELAATGRRPVPVTRDMNPIYTGKDVSYIDTKQAQRRAESLLVDAEAYATIASWTGALFPHAAIDKAWRQLVYGAHHDAITGSESDQVYLDLLTTWRDAHDLAKTVLERSLDALAETVAPSAELPTLTVFNPAAWERTDLVKTRVAVPGWDGFELVGPDGSPVPVLAEAVTEDESGRVTGATVTFLATVPGTGYDARWRLRPASGVPAGWQQADGSAIQNEHYRVAVDPQRGGCVSELMEAATGRPLLREGEVGNELVLEQEYPEHPRFHEGPWHLVPTGRAVTSASGTATVRTLRSALGECLTVTGELDGIRYEQRLTLWRGLPRVECSTTVDEFEGADQLLRVRWPVEVPGALPVSETGAAVVGRGFALIGEDSADHPWTLDNPAASWFGLSSTVRVRINGNGAAHERAIGVAELVAPDGDHGAELRDLAVALAGRGVTSTTSRGDGSRYGILSVDSNLPDVRLAVGGPEQNSFTQAVLDATDEQYRIELDKQVARQGWAMVWVPAERPLREVWRPSADLSGARDLPVLVLVGDEALQRVVADLDDATVEVEQTADAATGGDPSLSDHTVALVNTGMPGFAVTSDGALHLSLMRSCTGWPSGVWIDPPRRTAPDGSNFQLQHWTHEWSYSLVSGPGDWRSMGAVRAGFDANHPLRVSTANGSGAGEPTGRFLTVESDGDVVLAALKPRGNPVAEGREPAPTDEITLRLYEAAGRTAAVQVSAQRPLSDGASLDLLERAAVSGARTADGELSVQLQPMQIATVGARVDGVTAGERMLGPAAEAHQPIYTRYWLDNTGPAPLGNLPVAVHLEPPVVTRNSAGPVELRVSVASDRSDRTVSGEVRLLLPDGWTADDAPLRYDLEPGAWWSHTVSVRPDGDVGGTYWVRARTRVGEQDVEDVARVLLGHTLGPELTVHVEPGVLRLTAGQEAEVVVRLDNAARTAVTARLQLISPWHTWDLIPEWDGGAEIPAGETTTVRFPVRVPADSPAGTWWALVKVAAAGLLHYAEPVRLEVRS